MLCMKVVSDSGPDYGMAHRGDQIGAEPRKKTRRTRITASAHRAVETMICGLAFRVLMEKRGSGAKPSVEGHERK